MTKVNNLGTVHHEYDICLIGSPKSGKTSLALQYIHHVFVEETDALEEMYHKSIRRNGIHNEFSILDTNSYQDIYSTSRKKQIINSSAMIFTYAINDYHGFQEMVELYERTGETRTSMPPTVVVGLKSDLESERQVSFEQGRQFAVSVNSICFVEASSKLAVHINEVFDPIINILVQQYQERRSSAAVIPGDSIQSLREALTTPSPTISPAMSHHRSESITPRIEDLSIRIPDFSKSNNPVKPTIDEEDKPETDGTIRVEQPHSPRANEEDKDNRIESTKSTNGCCVIV